MEVQELRIGNLISRKKKVITVTHHLISNMVDLYSVNVRSLYKPIPLTEEWLLKFGFEQSRLGVWLVSGLALHYSELAATETYFECRVTYVPIKVKYVHQLQNLYFALTGEELTVKES